MMQENTTTQRSKESLTPRELILKYLRYLPWVVISVAIALVGAYVKLRYSTPIYSVSSKLLVNQSNLGSGGGEKFDDIFMMQRADKLNDEIEIIRSRSMAARVVNSLRLQKQIYNKGKIRSGIYYPGEEPFNFEILQLKDSSAGFSLVITLLPNNQYSINDQAKKYSINEIVDLPAVNFRISPNNKDLSALADNEFIISWVPTAGMAGTLSGNLGVTRVNDYANVLQLSYQTDNPRLGVDILNTYMDEYQKVNLEDKREIAAKTLSFIDEQLKAVFHDLGGVEQNLKNYREKNKVFNTKAQSEMFLGEQQEANKIISEHEVRNKITEYLYNYLADQTNKYRVIPSMLGIEEPTLLQQATEFNRLQLERETAIKTTAPNNPRMEVLETAIEKLRLDMLENLNNVKKTEDIALSALKSKSRQAEQQVNSIPSIEKQLLEVTRQQGILEELYQYLLQKKLETAIGSASTISNIKVVEPAIASGVPIGPNKKGLYILAVVLGLAVPIGIILLKEYLNDKITSKQEIEQSTMTPILGEIGHADEGNTLVVTRNSRKFLAEQFRIVRSNLQYILPNVQKPVLLITSSYSGEGKSFVSTNLGAAIALSGKRTVILEFDIRKPKIMKGLGLHERKGITNYIVGNIDIHDVINSVPDVENLYVIPCGPVPPNPAEMLLSERVEQLFSELRKEFDAIIIDTAPIGLVSDAVSLGKYADGAIYIVRHNYTLKKQLQLIDNIYHQKKLPHVSIIINDISARGGYGYYGYGNYGYGYGYGVNGSGSENGYFENSSTNSRRRFKWFKSIGKR